MCELCHTTNLFCSRKFDHTVPAFSIPGNVYGKPGSMSSQILQLVALLILKFSSCDSPAQDYAFCVWFRIAQLNLYVYEVVTTQCMIMQELKILKTLRYHRNVAHFYGSFIQNGDVLLVFEYMQVRF